MKINLLWVIVGLIIILLCMMKVEPRLRAVPNINFTLNRQLNKSNPRKQEMMHVFSNMEVPGWKWDKLYA
jgi:hypothetical protein